MFRLENSYVENIYGVFGVWLLRIPPISIECMDNPLKMLESVFYIYFMIL
jgi:hypothetical protein